MAWQHNFRAIEAYIPNNIPWHTNFSHTYEQLIIIGIFYHLVSFTRSFFPAVWFFFLGKRDVYILWILLGYFNSMYWNMEYARSFFFCFQIPRSLVKNFHCPFLDKLVRFSLESNSISNCILFLPDKNHLMTIMVRGRVFVSSMANFLHRFKLCRFKVKHAVYYEASTIHDAPSCRWLKAHDITQFNGYLAKNQHVIKTIFID